MQPLEFQVDIVVLIVVFFLPNFTGDIFPLPLPLLRKGKQATPNPTAVPILHLQWHCYAIKQSKKLQLSTLPARSGAALVSCPPLTPHNPSNEGLQLLKTLSYHALIIPNSTLRAVLNQPQPYKSRVRGAHMMSFCWFLF